MLEWCLRHDFGEGIVEARKYKEREFFNKSFAENRRKSVSRFYSIVHSSRDLYRKSVIAGCEGKRVLECGCGPGSSTFLLAKNGAQIVVGIDISEVALKQAKARAIQEEVTRKTTFLLVDAEEMAFPGESFDTVCGSGILHHLDVDKTFKELARVLKPNGEGIFIEPLGMNPAINLFRALTPGLRTQDERPLLMKDVELAKRHFKKVEAEFFHLFIILAGLFYGTRIFPILAKVFDGVDRLIFSLLPIMKFFAWMVVIRVSEPKRNSFDG